MVDGILCYAKMKRFHTGNPHWSWRCPREKELQALPRKGAHDSLEQIAGSYGLRLGTQSVRHEMDVIFNLECPSILRLLHFVANILWRESYRVTGTRRASSPLPGLTYMPFCLLRLETNSTRTCLTVPGGSDL